MDHVFHRKLKTSFPLMVRGEGPYVFDATGKRYLDGSSGAAASCLGYSHAAVISAIKNQLDCLPSVHSGFCSNEPMEALADALIADAPVGLDRVLFTSGGSEAVEASIKIARQYFVEAGEPERRYIIARRQSYHGATLGALSATGNIRRREPFAPLLLQTVRHVAPCYAYRDRQSDESEEEYGLRVANELEVEILNLGPRNVAMFIAETVVGAMLGAVPAVPGYFKRIREICDKYGVLLILDEVMCGIGRTGTLHACEQEGIAPDLLPIAKSLGAGYQPIGALLISDRLYEAFRSGSGRFLHGSGNMGHATACAGALAVLRVIGNENLLERVHHLGDVLNDALHTRFGNHPFVGDIRGRGLLRAIEFVAERSTKRPFDRKHNVSGRIRDETLRRGLICYPESGTIDGINGDHVLLAPPYIANEPFIHEIVEILGEAVDSVVQDT